MFQEDLGRGETDEVTKKLKPNMAIKHGATGIHRFKKKKKEKKTGIG